MPESVEPATLLDEALLNGIRVVVRRSEPL
jgi:hypothetical protein